MIPLADVAQEAIQQAINALSLGSTYALLALGPGDGVLDPRARQLRAWRARHRGRVHDVPSQPRGRVVRVSGAGGDRGGRPHSRSHGASCLPAAPRCELPHPAVRELRALGDHPERLPGRDLPAPEGCAAAGPLQRGDQCRALHDRLAAGDHDRDLWAGARRADAIPAALDPGARDARRRAGLPGDEAHGHPRQPGDRDARSPSLACSPGSRRSSSSPGVARSSHPWASTRCSKPSSRA